MLRFRPIFVMVMIFAFAAAGMPTAAQEGDDGPARVGLRPDAPTYALHGPYWVGVQDLPITLRYPDGTTRQSAVTVWYPASNPDGKPEAYTYPSDTRTTAYAGTLFFPRIGHALQEAAPDREGAPYPLIIYTHGGAVYRWFNLEYYEHLASHGFVVLSVDHEDSPADRVLFPRAELSRQWDVTALIDLAASLTGSDSTFVDLIDVEQIGVTGYSAGTTMLAGGARRNSQAKRAWCTSDALKAFPLAPLICGDEDARDQAWAGLLDLAEPPDGLWPDVGDARVDAIAAIDGFAFDFGPEGMSHLRVPALLIFFRDAPFSMPYSLDISELGAGRAPVSVATLHDANHFTFTQSCKADQITPQVALLCAEPVWDKQRARDLVHHFTTAFLLDVLKGDAEAHAALLPDAVSFPGITYETTMH